MSMAATIPIIILVQILSTLENTITINYSQVQLSDIWSWPICKYLQPAKLDVLIITFLGLTCPPSLPEKDRAKRRPSGAEATGVDRHAARM